MSEIIYSAAGVASIAVVAALAIIGLLVLFCISRASQRSRQQIQLLEALLVEQKRQNVLLHRLSDVLQGKESPDSTSGNVGKKDFTRLIPER